MNKFFRNKSIIIIIFLIVTFILYSFFFRNNKSIKKISDEEAKKIISDTFGDKNIEKITGQALSLAKTDGYMTMVVKDQYFLIDFSQRPPKIHQFKSNKPDIKVKVLKIEKDRFLVEHDDHEHWVEGSPGKGVKVGDFIYIKDPHTYLQDLKKH